MLYATLTDADNRGLAKRTLLIKGFSSYGHGHIPACKGAHFCAKRFFVDVKTLVEM